MGQHHPAHRGQGQLLKAEPTAGQRAGGQQAALTLRHPPIGLHQHQFRACRQGRPIGGQGLSQLQGEMALPGPRFHQRQGTVQGLLLQPLGDLGGQEGREIRPE